jgi:hypothetical protein
MAHLKYRAALAVSTALALSTFTARAEEATETAKVEASDAVPGSAVRPGPGLSPQAPPVPPAPGGRAPSFGAPAEKSAASFRIGGRFFGYEAIGIGRKPVNPPEGYSGTAIHAPALSTGKMPYWGGVGATLNLDYGTPSLRAYVTYYFRMNRKEYNGYYNVQQGPSFGVAYLLMTPDPIRGVRLQVKAGSFIEVYGAPHQWGWGVFGPMLGLKGYGETTTAEWDLTRSVRASFVHGILVNPGVPEDYVRGDYDAWIETGSSSWVHHAHLGFSYEQYVLKLHYASAYGTDDRTYLNTALGGPPHDGRMDTYLVEGRWQRAPWGHVGLTAGLYNFDHASSVGNGVWWAVDWTQGSREMINKYLGPFSEGNGKVAVLSAEYNFSVASILWHPRTFSGNAPDIRVSIAAMLTRTLSTEDPLYKNATGYFLGIDTEYRMTENLSLTFQAYGEDRVGSLHVPKRIDPGTSADSSSDASTAAYDDLIQRWRVYSLNPGISYRSNWNSLDRIQLIYSRRFYNAAVDNNGAQPLDHHMIVLGGYVTF